MKKALLSNATSKEMSAERFLLILDWDGTDYFSAPIDCASVARIKAELQIASTKTSAYVADAGFAVLGHALGAWLTATPLESNIETTTIHGSKKYARQDPSFDYTVRGADLIPIAEHADWKVEYFPNGIVRASSFEICSIDGDI